VSFLPPVVMEIRAHASQAFKEMQQVSAESEAMAKKSGIHINGMSNEWNKMAQVGKVAAAATVVTGAVIAGVAVHMAADFEKSTLLLKTAAGESKEGLEVVRKGILDVSESTGTSAENLSEGMYILEKAGYRGADGVHALEMAAQGAKAENVDLATMTGALTDVMLNYHAEAKDAASYTNQLVVASGRAKTTMEEFSSSMGSLVPIGAKAGLSFAQLGGALATITQHGVSARQGAQNLAHAIQTLQSPAGPAIRTMQAMGLSVQDVSMKLGQKGLTGTLEDLTSAISSHMGKDGKVIQDSMMQSKTATQDLQTMIGKMPPSLAEMAKGFLDGSVTQKQFTKNLQGMGASGSAMAKQFMTLAQKANGFNDLLKSGRPEAMTYTDALSKMMGGQDGLRVALMLTGHNMEGFKKNVEAVNEAAAHGGDEVESWADTQQTLSVQLDQTKAMLEKLGIELGTNLMPSVKGAVSGFKDLVHGFEEGNPVLLGIAGTIGGALALSILAYITNLTIAGVQTTISTAKMVAGWTAAKIAAASNFITVQAGALASGQRLQELGVYMSTTSGFLKVGALGVAGLVAALAGIEKSKANVTIESITHGLTALAEAADSTDLDKTFQSWDLKMFEHAPDGVNNLADAVDRLAKKDGLDQFNQSFDGLTKTLGWGEAGITKIEERFRSMGESLSQMVSKGDTGKAGEAFKKLTAEFERNGKGAKEALDSMPAYRDKLIELADAAGVSHLSQEALAELAGGKVPDAMQKAAETTKEAKDATEQAAKKQDEYNQKLDDAGVSADGLVTSLSKVLDGMIATGMATLSSREAATRYSDKLRDVQKDAEEIVAAGGKMGRVLNDNGSDFDLTTEAGGKASNMLGDVMKSGLDLAKAMSNDTSKGVGDVTKSLKETHDQMIETAKKFGMGKDQAEALTRSLLGIPDKVSIDSWMSDYAKKVAGDTKKAIDDIPKRVSSVIDVSVNENGAIADYANIVAQAKAAGHKVAFATGGMAGDVPGFAAGGSPAVRGFASGGGHDGPVYGGGSSTSDSIDAKLSVGEFVMKRRSVLKYGLGFMDAVNEGTYEPGDGSLGASNLDPAPAGGGRAPGLAGGDSAAPGSTYHSADSVTNNTITLNVTTNASAPAIAGALGWELRGKS
jgi:TP901 family phage tail tape measure protein